MIMSMRKESGEITTNREEILKICANFYKSLYTQTVPTTRKYNEIKTLTQKKYPSLQKKKWKEP